MAKTKFSAKIVRIGNSTGIRIPKAAMREVGAAKDETVDVTIENEKEVMKPCPFCGGKVEWDDYVGPVHTDENAKCVITWIAGHDDIGFDKKDKEEFIRLWNARCKE